MNLDNKTSKSGKNISAFMKVGVAAVLAITIGTAGFQWNESRIDNHVEESQTLVVKNGGTTLTQLEQASKKYQETYNSNKQLIESLEKDQQLFKVMHIDIDLQKLKKENQSKFDVASVKINQDIVSTQKLMNLNERLPLQDEKREAYYYSTTDFENFKNANSNQLVNQQELSNINATLVKHTNFLKQAKQEIIQTIKEKLANKDYNFAQKRKEFQNKLAEGLYEEKKDLAEVKKEISEDEDLKNSVNLQEINNAEKSIGEMESLATGQIDKDEKLVNEMMAELSQKGIDLESTTNSSLAATSSTTPTANHSNGGGFNFMQYYLLHQWLSSSSSPSIGSGVSSSLAPNYNNSMRTSMHNSNPYDFKEPGSHLNQTMAAQGIKTSSGMSYHQMHENLHTTKSHISSYRSSGSRMSTRSSVSVRGSSGG